MLQVHFPSVVLGYSSPFPTRYPWVNPPSKEMHVSRAVTGAHPSLSQAVCQRPGFMLVFQLISWAVIRQWFIQGCARSHWLSQDCKILGCSSSTGFCFLYFCHNTPFLCWSPKTVILKLNIININGVFSAQSLQGWFFVGLFDWLFYSNCLPRFAFSTNLDWKKSIPSI